MSAPKDPWVDFWGDLQPELRTTAVEVFGDEKLSEIIAAAHPAASKKDKLQHLQSAVAPFITTKWQREPRDIISLFLFTLACAQKEIGDLQGEEQTWRLNNVGRHPSKSDLAALYNLALNLISQERYADAEAILRALFPVLNIKDGEKGERTIATWRFMAQAVNAQGGREEEGRSLMMGLKALAEGIEDDKIRREQVDLIDDALKTFK